MRRSKAERRKISPDLRYNSLNVQTVIHHVLKKGKKSTATKLVYDTMDLLGERSGKDPLEVFETALHALRFVLAVWVVQPIKSRWKLPRNAVSL